MRQIVLDTETTGLEPEAGHRIIEIGCVELVSRRFTGRRFHEYLNPERDIDEGAVEVHGLTLEQLRDKPRFVDIVPELLGFLDGAELVIHNAPFDVGFINHELRRVGSEVEDIAQRCRILDTLEMARRLHPGQKNSLDALCRRYEIDNSQRQLHGALLDAEILADVYLAMTGGQVALSLDGAQGGRTSDGGAGPGGASPHRPVVRTGTPLRVVRASEEELAEHARRLEAVAEASGGRCVWHALERDPAD
ncbi:MAG TPA: DNA polymerase III subunit epsilon [Gammaproteobacteria bacterium]|nr:DNA polymerase III subunit epsilon [Gammaproteobacteria bacterium]